MARMIPARPPDFHGSEGEKRVFRSLRSLPDNVVIRRDLMGPDGTIDQVEEELVEHLSNDGHVPGEHAQLSSFDINVLGKEERRKYSRAPIKFSLFYSTPRWRLVLAGIDEFHASIFECAATSKLSRVWEASS